MLIIKCPYCNELREQNEFSAGEEAFIGRPENPEKLNDEQWADYVFYRDNVKGEHWEQWVHTYGCRKYFLVKRSTIDNEIKQTAKVSESLKHKNIV